MPDSMNRNRMDHQNDNELFFDKTTDDKVHKHLIDINDDITDKDTQNVNTNINSDNLPGRESETSKKEQESKRVSEDKNDDDQNEQIPSSYNILDS